MAEHVSLREHVKLWQDAHDALHTHEDKARDLALTAAVWRARGEMVVVMVALVPLIAFLMKVLGG